MHIHRLKLKSHLVSLFFNKKLLKIKFFKYIHSYTSKIYWGRPFEDARKNKLRPNKFSKGQKNLTLVKKILFWSKKSYSGQNNYSRALNFFLRPGNKLNYGQIIYWRVINKFLRSKKFFWWLNIFEILGQDIFFLVEKKT